MAPAQVAKLTREVQTAKNKLTKFIEILKNDDELEHSAKKSILDDCQKQFDAIKDKQETLQNSIEENEMDQFITEIAEYQTKMFSELSSLQNTIQNNASNEEVHTNPIQLKAPKLELPSFSDNKSCAFNYVNFKSAFTNTMNSLPGIDNATKFIYLRAQLTGRAFSLIANLNVSEEAYETALSLLDVEFLNRSDIFIKTMTQFINSEPANNLETACNSVVNLRSTMTELQNLGFDLMETEASNQFVSLIFRTKLPNFFVREIARNCKSPHPDMNDFFENYAQVKQLLQDNKIIEKAPKTAVTKKNADKTPTEVNGKNSTKNNSATNLQGNSKQTEKTCKFCQLSNHTTTNCRKYDSYESRKRRTAELGLCSHCLSGKHATEKCLGKNDKLPFNCVRCKSNGHVTPLCSTNNIITNKKAFTNQ